MKKRNREKRTVTRGQAQEFIAAIQAMGAEEKGSTGYKLGLDFRAHLSRNVSTLKPIADEMDAAVTEARQETEKVMKKFAEVDESGNPIILPSAPGTRRYQYGPRANAAQEAIRALGFETKLEKMAKVEEEVELYLFNLDEYPQEIEKYFEALKVMVYDFA